jgi:hypothetical protein
VDSLAPCCDGCTAALLAGITSHSRAQLLLEIAAGIKFCKTLTDGAQRLKCIAYAVGIAGGLLAWIISAIVPRRLL